LLNDHIGLIDKYRRQDFLICNVVNICYSLNLYPGCGVDGIQWSINNIQTETHITKEEWGNKCHGIELFNDFT